MAHSPRLFSARRTLTSLVAGLVTGGVVVALGAPGLGAIVGWTVASSVLLAWVWRISWPRDPAGTKELAEDEGSAYSMDSFVLAAAVAGLAVVVYVLILGSGRTDFRAVSAVILGVVAIVLSWALVHTVFAFKYARLYYVDEDGGIEFNQSTPPSYSDFAYLAFTVGMSFAVSDSNATDTRVRKAILGHALLSYGFATVIIAMAINLVAGLG